MKIDLPDVTLICASSIKIPQSLLAIQKCCELVNFGDVKFFTHLPIEGATTIKHLASWTDYSTFIFYELHKHITTNYVVICQWDGYCLDNTYFDPIYYEYDFIGHICKSSPNTLNGGFSWRSKKILQASGELKNKNSGIRAHPEDYGFTKYGREHFTNLGFKIAPRNVCDKFAKEEWKKPTSWGFHSKKLAPLYPDNICPTKVYNANTI